jgi:hypothetical protein
MEFRGRGESRRSKVALGFFIVCRRSKVALKPEEKLWSLVTSISIPSSVKGCPWMFHCVSCKEMIDLRIGGIESDSAAAL